MIAAGQKFYRLTSVQAYGQDKYGNNLWEFKCSCGGTVVATPYRVKKGKVKSCGCFRKEYVTLTNTTHGKNHTPIHMVWNNMRYRCSRSTRPDYKHYGGRGIKVCKRWKKFENFYADMGDPPSSKHSIDRIDVNGDYCKENCRWATRLDQARNRRSSHLITINGETRCLAEWAELYKIGRYKVYHRINKLGWDPVKAITEAA